MSEIDSALCDALVVLLAGKGPLPQRLRRIAPVIAALPSADFPTATLRLRHRQLADELIFIGLVPDGIRPRRAPLTNDEAVLLAVRLVRLTHETVQVAQSDWEIGGLSLVNALATQIFRMAECDFRNVTNLLPRIFTELPGVYPTLSERSVQLIRLERAEICRHQC